MSLCWRASGCLFANERVALILKTMPRNLGELPLLAEQVPVSVTIGLLKKAMAENRDGMKMVLIDGFPR